MAVSRPLRRLLRLLTIQEHQCRLALESAIGDLRQLELAFSSTIDQERGGRRLVVTSARTGELPDRLAGLEESHSAERRAAALSSRIEEAERNVEARRQEFLAKRVECRQAETLIREAEAKDAIVTSRRAQQALDDWYLNRLQGDRGAARPSIRLPSSLPPATSTLPDARDQENLSGDLPAATPQS